MSNPRAIQALVASLALAASSCLAIGGESSSSPSTPAPAPPAELGSMRNVAVRGAVWTGSHPTPEDLSIADRRGIAGAIDLSVAEERAGYDVAAVCRELGMEYVRVDIPIGAPIPDAAVDQALVELRRRVREPVLLFSGSGDRAAMILAIWRALDGGIGVEEAIGEARRCGMKPGRPVEFVRAQVERLSHGV